MMKLVLSGTPPWTNPTLTIYQKEFTVVYPGMPYHLQPNDAVIHPVSIVSLGYQTIVLMFSIPQTNRQLGVLRSQIGSEGLAAAIEYIPGQYSKRMLDSKAARSTYIETLLASAQHPFIWEYFRPGTIEIPRGEENYYDEVSCFPFSCTQLPLTVGPRNAEAYSSPFRFSVLFLCTSLHTAFDSVSRLLKISGTQLVHSHLPPPP
jgi:hypothetical protein